MKILNRELPFLLSFFILALVFCFGMIYSSFEAMIMIILALIVVQLNSHSTSNKKEISVHEKAV